MFDIKKYEPLWNVWFVESLIGQGSFSKVYKIRREAFGKAHYSAVKIITIPYDESEIQLMKREGLDDAAMGRFLQTLIKNITSEIHLMSELRGNDNIVSFEDYQLIEGTGSIGWTILIRMELLTSLGNFIEDAFLTQAEVVRLGIHICRALELCAQKKIIHRDIKPDNIFISPNNAYKLGDFGVARQIEHMTSGLSKKGANTYMAPEVFRYESYGAGADIYSLGIVMYSLLNRNRAPFLPNFPEPIMYGDRDEALRRRINGEALPTLEGVNPKINNIILKACAYNNQDRFSSPEEMRELLETTEV